MASPRRQPASKALDPLRINSAEQREIFQTLDSSAADFQGRNSRRHARHPYRLNPGVIMQITHPGGSSTIYLVRPRNLSHTGLGVLHGGFVYTGSRCAISLLRRDGQRVRIEGRTVRCHHLSRHFHEVGIQFDQPIRISDFVDVPEPVDPSDVSHPTLPQLEGHVLYIESCMEDRQSLQEMASLLGVRVTCASNGIEAMDFAEQARFDLIIVSVELPEVSGLDVISLLRDHGYELPAIALAGMPANIDKALEHGCIAALQKPEHLESLSHLFVEHLQQVDPKPEAAIVSHKE